MINTKINYGGFLMEFTYPQKNSRGIEVKLTGDQKKALNKYLKNKNIVCDNSLSDISIEVLALSIIVEFLKSDEYKKAEKEAEDYLKEQAEKKKLNDKEKKKRKIEKLTEQLEALNKEEAEEKENA